MHTAIQLPPSENAPWNKGRLIGQKRAPKPMLFGKFPRRSRIAMWLYA